MVDLIISGIFLAGGALFLILRKRLSMTIFRAGIALLFIGCLAGVLMWHFYFNKNTPDIASRKASKTFAAEQFITEVKGDADKADNGKEKIKYKDEIIELTGKIDHTEADSKGNINVFFSDADGMIQCTIIGKDNASANGIKKGDDVKVKGRYVGTQSDITSGGVLVQLSNCIVEGK